MNNAKYRKEVRAFLFTARKKFIVVHAHSYAHGLFSPPKGGVLQNETLEEALSRELREELYISQYLLIKKSKIIQTLEYPYDIQLKVNKVGSLIFSFWVLLLDNSYTMNEKEIDSVKELSVKEFKDLMSSKVSLEEFKQLNQEIHEVLSEKHLFLL